MAETGADILVEDIIDWGVDTVFGLPGDGINGIMEALRIRQDQVRLIQLRHEESAAFMACAYAKYTGKLGCCLATSGPGGIHLLNGLYDAKLDQAPVLAITGQTYSDLKDGVVPSKPPSDQCKGDEIKWEQIVFLGNPEYGCELHNPNFAKYADACGGLGWTVEKPQEIRPTLQHALGSNKPCLIEVVVDPFEPPMPPRVSAKQALYFAEALIKVSPKERRSR
jgi:thiamine pyrophosphate-dependent acetolactate synthase large subunit-like protein